MVLKGEILENKRRRRSGDKEFFFVLKRIIGRAQDTCGKKPLTLF
jgi:hypothetical protein